MLLTALAGCTGAAETGGSAAAGNAASVGGTTSAAPAPLTLPSPAAEGPASEAVVTSTAAAGEAPEPDSTAEQALLLEAGGLGVVLDETRIEHLPFGTAAGTVRTVVTRLIGRLATTRRTDCEQGLRTSSAAGGLELLFRGDRFVGWTDTGTPGRRLTTGDGIRVGITVAALQDSGTDVTLDPLPGGGGEWTSVPGGLYGRTTSVAATGRVTLVSSGETCLPD